MATPSYLYHLHPNKLSLFILQKYRVAVEEGPGLKGMIQICSAEEGGKLNLKVKVLPGGAPGLNMSSFHLH